MSVKSFTYCIPCNERPMEIGDGGMVGTPHLKVASDHNKDWGVKTYRFGWIYDGLQAISLVTHEIEAYKRFLEKHAGHEMFLGNDHMDDDEMPDVDHDATTRFELPSDGFVQGSYELGAGDGDSSFRTSWDGEHYLPFEQRVLSAKEVARFLKRLTAPEVYDSISRPNPTVDPYADLGALVDFIRAHAKQELTARLVPKE